MDQSVNIQLTNVPPNEVDFSEHQGECFMN